MRKKNQALLGEVTIYESYLKGSFVAVLSIQTTVDTNLFNLALN